MSRIFTLVIAVFLSGAVKSANKVEYVIEMTQPAHHIAQVTVTFPAHQTETLDVMLPAWRAGRYEILDLANGIRYFEAKTTVGEPLPFSIKDKSTWTIETNGQAVEVSYQLYANQLGYRSRHIDDTHAFLNASGTFVYSPTFRNTELTVKLDVPKNWRSVSGMKSLAKHKFIADNYDILADSPIETGINQFYTFEVEDRNYELVIWGKGDYDVDKMIADLKKLDPVVGDIWGEYPYQRYVYMVHATSGARGATEHINSTIIQRQRDRFGSRSDHLGFITTAAHELVHTWNVKAYRPDALVPYDYQKESYTPLLWVAEGSTSYYHDLLVRRAGISTQKEFHNALSDSIEALINRPGREVQPIAESSIYKWSEQSNDFTYNHGTNIYAKGSMVSWWLDVAIRKATNNQKSYDDVQRILFERYPVPEKGFDDADLLTVVNEVTGTDFSQFWRNYIWGTKPIPFDEMLDFFGLSIERVNEDKQKIDLGWRANQDLKLTGVRRNSPAWEAGFTTDDILVAINDMRLTSSNLNKKLQDLKPNEKAKITFFRRDELMTTTITAKKNNNRGIKLSALDNPSAEQKARYQSWSGYALFDDKKTDTASD